MNITKTQERIREAQNTPPIRTLSDNDLNDLVNHLAMLMGVETTAPERIIVANFFKNNYATLHRDEIILAFDLAYSGKFNLSVVERPSRISSRYAGHVLTAYENYKRVETKGVESEFLSIPQMSESEIQKKNREAIKFFYERHKENRRQLKLDSGFKEKWYPCSVCYDWLKSNGVNLAEPKEVKPHEIKDRRRALEIQADALTDSKTEIVHEYFDTLIAQGK